MRISNFIRKTSSIFSNKGFITKAFGSATALGATIAGFQAYNFSQLLHVRFFYHYLFGNGAAITEKQLKTSEVRALMDYCSWGANAIEPRYTPGKRIVNTYSIFRHLGKYPSSDEIEGSFGRFSCMSSGKSREYSSAYDKYDFPYSGVAKKCHQVISGKTPGTVLLKQKWSCQIMTYAQLNH